MKPGRIATALSGILVATMLAGPAHARAAEPGGSHAKAVPAAGETFLDVPADAAWVDTGALIAAGAGFTITASGSWTPGLPETGYVGPDGSATLWADNFLNIADIGVCAGCASSVTEGWGALVGYIGDSPPAPGSYAGSSAVLAEAESVFFVGSDLAETAWRTGELWLAMNDDAYSGNTSDNLGSVTVAIGAYDTAIDPAIGAWHGGNKVTITGQGLNGAVVKVDGKVAAPYDAAPDGTSLTIWVPRRSAPTVGATSVDVELTPLGGQPVSIGTYTYRGAAVFLIRGLESQLPPGAPASWDKQKFNSDTFYQPNGLAGSLLAAGWPAATLLNYSYKGGHVSGGVWVPDRYALTESYPAFIRTTGAPGSVPTLDNEVRAYIAAHPDIDIYLVGHSQGGVIAMTYLAYLRSKGMTDGEISSGDATGHLAGVATMDSPIGGLDRDAAILLACSLISLVDPSVFGAVCSPAARLTSGLKSPDVDDLQTIKDHGSGDPWGATRSVSSLVSAASVGPNQTLAEWAAAATQDIPVLTIGNKKDGAIGIGTIGGSLSTQWVRNGGPGVRVYSRSIDSTTCGTWYVVRAFFCAGADHNLVAVNPAARTAVVDLFSGWVPGTTGFAVPTAAAMSTPMREAGMSVGATGATIAAPAPVVALSGTVTGGGVPLSGVSVMAVPVGGSNSSSALSAANGTYSLNVPAGTYKIAVVDPTGTRAAGYYSGTGFTAVATHATSVVVATFPIGGLKVDLPIGHAISGKLAGPAGAAIAGMPILIETVAGETVSAGETGADGTWAATVPAGTYRVRSLDPEGEWTDGYYAAAGTVTNAAAATTVTMSGADVEDVNLTSRPVPPTARITALVPTSTSASVAMSWDAAIGARPVATFDVRFRRAAWNGVFGAFATWKRATAATSGTYPALKGSTYCYSVKARDTAGLASAWTAETCTAVPLDDRSLTRSPGWTAGSGAAYYAGTFLRTSTFGAKLTRTGVRAKSIAIVATTCSTCGSAKVYWGSTLLRTISLYSATTMSRRVLPVAAWGSPRSGTLSIKVSTRGKKVIIDGVAIRLK
jgi:hypothetical protein